MKKNKTVLRMDQSYVVIPYQNPLIGIQMPSIQTTHHVPLLPKPPAMLKNEHSEILPPDLDMPVDQLYGATPKIENFLIISERCRMCAEKRKKLQPIFGAEGRAQEVAHKMGKFLYINVQEDDKLPLGVCAPCLVKLQASHDLALSCAAAQSRLSSLISGQSHQIQDVSSPAAPSPVESDWSDHDDNDEDDDDDSSNEGPSNFAEPISPVPPRNGSSRRRKTNAAPMRCAQCLISFSTYEEISTHYLTEHNQYLCTVCTSVFKTDEELADHLEIHKGQSEFNTSLRTQFNRLVKKSPKKQSASRKRPRKIRPKASDSIPITYSETKEGKKIYECSVCNKVFHIRCRFVTHIQRHSGQRKTECQICHKMFFNNDDLRNHMTTHNKSAKFTCEVCNREFNCKRYLNVHFQKVHNKEWFYKCKLCEENHPSVPDIEKHIEINHKNVFSNMEDRFYTKMSDYQCHLCKKYSSNKYNLQDHIQAHKREGTEEVCENLLKEKQFQCEKCAKMFASKTSLGVHLQIHAGEKPLQCQYCPKRFLYKQSLDQHEMIHVGNRPYKCKTCPKSYVHISALKTHVKKVHLNLRPFVCEFCNKGFPRKGNLNVHLRIHTGVRPFNCRYCERDFTQKQEMQRHELTHTNDTLYKCSNKCGFGSNRRKTVSEHEAACGYICVNIEEHNGDDVSHFLILN